MSDAGAPHGTAKVRTCLWFEKDGEEAAAFYVSLLPGSRIEAALPSEPEGPALLVEFTLAGAPYAIVNGGPHYRLSPAASIAVRTHDQVETDRLWNALTAGGGADGQCGWLTDRYGVSWQIVPEALIRMQGDPDRAAAGRAQAAMLRMRKIDIVALEAAFNES